MVCESLVTSEVSEPKVAWNLNVFKLSLEDSFKDLPTIC